MNLLTSCIKLNISCCEGLECLPLLLILIAWSLSTWEGSFGNQMSFHGVIYLLINIGIHEMTWQWSKDNSASPPVC